MTKNVIEVNNLEHSYGSIKAVDNISFNVKQGEIFSFLGPNGAGKSTVINILTTLKKIQKGEARVNGYDVAKEPKSVRKSIGIVFQMLCLDHEMTVSENLEYHGKIYSMSKKDAFTFEYTLTLPAETTGDKKTTITFNLNRINVQGNEPSSF